MKPFQEFFVAPAYTFTNLMFLLTLLEILYLSYLFSFQHAADCSEYWYNICRVTINSNEI